ncbi:tripartite tricarboxylate transporter TctB family protein [Desulfocurvus sp. DL9XJH121]
MKVKTGDFVMALVLLLFGALLYQRCCALRPACLIAGGPVFFPKILVWIMGLLSLVLIYQSISRPGAPATCEEKKTVKPAVDWRTLALRWSLVGLVMVYLLVMPWLGYIPSTVLFLIVSMCLLGPTKPKNLVIYALVSGIVTSILYYVFGVLLTVFLP